MDADKFLKELKEIETKLLEGMKPLDPEFAKILEDNREKLYIYD